MQSIIRPISIALVLVVVGLAACAPNDADDVPDDVTTHELLHVGYDIAREIGGCGRFLGLISCRQTESSTVLDGTQSAK